MRKLLIFLVFLLALFCIPFNTFAAWTTTVTAADVKGHYLYLKVYCISDGSASGNINIVSLMDSELQSYVRRGVSMMVMNTDPGTGGAAPTTTISLDIVDIAGLTIFDSAALTNVSDTIGTDLSTTLNQYPIITTTTNFSINDIGDASDSVTFYILCWMPKN